MEWKLQVLGTNSAVPTPDRHPSAQLLDTGRQLYLIDCGEGTQIRMSLFKVRRSRIERIFISHLHGDHIFGLPGLINSYNLFRRTDPLYIYGPTGIQHFLHSMLDATQIRLSYPLEIHEHRSDKPQVICKTDHIKISTIPLKHRIPTTGYLFKESVHPRRINPEATTAYQVPYQALESIQKGKDWLSSDGQLVPNDLLTLPGANPLSFAYCSDTAYHLPIVPLITGVDLLYHESTFLQDLAREAQERGHSTAAQAAEIASKARVEKLLLGHFSSRYKNTTRFLSEAQEVFPNAHLAEEGKVYVISR